MPLFEYRCDACGKTHEILVALANRNAPQPCPACNAGMPRMFSSPKIFNERAGCIEGRPDEFWERADRHKESQLKKRVDADREKLRYGDKETVSKLKTAHDNLARQGEHERAESVARKLDEAK